MVGTDSHTTMIDGLGVAGWGVGGIEAEAAMLGQVYLWAGLSVKSHIDNCRVSLLLQLSICSDRQYCNYL